MARKKGTRIEEESRKGLTHGAFKNPLDVRIQKKKSDEALKKLNK